MDIKLKDLRQDTKNMNRGTPRGSAQLERSLRQYGAGRSVLCDKNGKLIAGNKTHQAALELGLDAVVVETDGTRVVVVKRTDLDLDDDAGTARALSIADNRVSEVGLEWDVDNLLDVAGDIDLGQFFFEEELKDLGIIADVDLDLGDGVESGDDVVRCETCGQRIGEKR